MTEETYYKACAIKRKIDIFKDEMTHIKKSDTLYYRESYNDGSFPKVVPFLDSAKGQIKSAVEKYYEEQIAELNKQFEAL